VIAETDYHILPLDTKKTYINTLDEYRKEKAAAKMVSKKNVSKSFGKTLAMLQPEVRMDCTCAREKKYRLTPFNIGRSIKSAHRM
jgi:hypothetical protein